MTPDYGRKTLHQEIFRKLRDRIVHLEYPPGMLLVEKELCAEFKVSRTPLREAVRKLADMNLVTVIPRFGTHVSEIDINEIRCAFEVKIELEGLAARAAAKRITIGRLAELKALIAEAEGFSAGEKTYQREIIDLDARFHEIIHAAAQNPILTGILDNLHHRCARLWNSAMSGFIYMPDIVDQLGGVYSALADRDDKKAAAITKEHVRYFIDKLKSQLL